MLPGLCRLRGRRKKMGVIYGTGVYEKGEIKDSPAFAEAYNRGSSIG